METFSTRPYQDPIDLPILEEILVAARNPDTIGAYPNLEDLNEMMARPAIQANTCFWQAVHGAPAGFSIVDEFNNLVFEILPWVMAQSAQAQALAGAMVAWGEQRLRQECTAGQREADGLSLDMPCDETDIFRLAVLAGNGFQRQPIQTFYYERPLDQLVEAAVLPAGFSIRPLAGEAEAPAAAELHRLAFDSDHMTTENRLDILRAPEYQPELDLVVVAPDGRLAASCICHYSPAENKLSGKQVGWTDPICTHPEFQRLGLGRALLLAGMGLLRSRGLEVARLGTSSENLAMQRTAEAAGFCLIATKSWFSKSLS